MENKKLRETEAAAVLGVKTKTLQDWRLKGKGPAYLKLGGTMVRYRLQDLQDFEQRSLRQPAGGAR